METIATNAVVLVHIVRDSIHECLLRHCLMECCIEYAYLWNLWEKSSNSIYTLEVCRIVKRSKVVASLECLDNLWSEDNRLCELLTTMHHTMTYCIQFVERLESTINRICKNLEDKFHTYCVLRNLLLNNLLAAILRIKLDECTRKTYFLNTALCENGLCLHLEELILDRTATAVKN